MKRRHSVKSMKSETEGKREGWRVTKRDRKMVKR